VADGTGHRRLDTENDREVARSATPRVGERTDEFQQRFRREARIGGGPQGRTSCRSTLRRDRLRYYVDIAADPGQRILEHSSIAETGGRLELFLLCFSSPFSVRVP